MKALAHSARIYLADAIRRQVKTIDIQHQQLMDEIHEQIDTDMAVGYDARGRLIDIITMRRMLCTAQQRVMGWIIDDGVTRDRVIELVYIIEATQAGFRDRFDLAVITRRIGELIATDANATDADWQYGELLS